MFKKFFQKRMQKDMAKLQQAREKCIPVLHAKGLSENQVIEVENIAFKKATTQYIDNPVIQAALKTYFETLTAEALKIGFDVS